MPFKLYFFCFFFFFFVSSSLKPAFLVHSLYTAFNDDVLGLIVFKAGLEDPENRLSSWNEDDETPCLWDAVECDPSSHRVTGIALDGFSLSGHIDKGLLRLQFLQRLSLSGNNFTGTINPDLPHLGGLRVVDFSGNSLSGSIPEEFFWQCGSLREVSFARNKLTGRIPESMSECFSLAKVDFSGNMLSGELPLGLWNLRGLEFLDLSENSLDGEIREGIRNLYNLSIVDLRKNWFSGSLPVDIGDCLSLKSVDFGGNFFSGELPSSMRRLGSCSSLSLGGNSFSGDIPVWIGEMRGLQALDLSSNNFSGRIPSSLGNLWRLQSLNLSRNELRGNLPESMSNSPKLTSLDASHNLLNGNLPSWIFERGVRTVSLSDRRHTTGAPAIESSTKGVLRVLSLSANKFSGEIPSNIGTGLADLRYLNFSSNDLSGPIPKSIGGLKSVEILDLSENRLTGIIPPEIGESLALAEFNLRNNHLSGKIPSEIAKCSSLTSLILSRNNLSGEIPATLANLTNLESVDLSFNELTGILPKELTNLSDLVSFNVSHNRLEGELPVGGFFNTIPKSSVSENPSLCGSVVAKSCPNVHPKPIVLNPNSSSSSSDSNATSSSSSEILGHKKRIILSISALVAIGAAAFILAGVAAVTVLNIRARSSSMSKSRAAAEAATLTFSGDGEEERSDEHGYNYSSNNDEDPSLGKLVMFSGDSAGFDGARSLLGKDREIGRGGFGTVYVASLKDSRSVAIKKLSSAGLTKSRQDFEREARRIGKARHENLVSLEGYYHTPSLQLMIYEFVPGGNLHDRLHGNPNPGPTLTWRERFSVILGVARGLAHLHRSGAIHYNIKSANVLLGPRLEPKLGDFGLARLLPGLDRCVLSGKIQGSLGYAAPEFACHTVKLTEKCDVYGFGVLVLEVVTGKRPVEYADDDVVVLCDSVRGSLENGRVEGCVDARLEGIYPSEEAVPAIKLGLICASQLPSNRPDMAEVVNILELIQCSSDAPQESE